jgi:hypothetical protein
MHWKNWLLMLQFFIFGVYGLAITTSTMDNRSAQTTQISTVSTIQSIEKTMINTMTEFPAEPTTLNRSQSNDTLIPTLTETELPVTTLADGAGKTLTSPTTSNQTSSIGILSVPPVDEDEEEQEDPASTEQISRSINAEEAPSTFNIPPEPTVPSDLVVDDLVGNLIGSDGVIEPPLPQGESVPGTVGNTLESIGDLPALPNVLPNRPRPTLPRTNPPDVIQGTTANGQPLPPVLRNPEGVSMLSTNTVAKNVLIFGIVGMFCIGIFVFNYDRFKTKFGKTNSEGSDVESFHVSTLTAPPMLMPRPRMDNESIGSVDLDSVVSNAQKLMHCNRTESDEEIDPSRPSMEELDTESVDIEFVHL